MTAPSFASAQDVADSLKRSSFTDSEKEWVEARLAEATDYIRALAGDDHIAPVTTSVYRDYAVRGEVFLPFRALHRVESVTREGHDVPHTLFERRVILHERVTGPVEITVVHGLSEVPPMLKAYAIGMVENQILLTEAGVGFKFGGLSSVQLDDFKLAFADGGDKTSLSLPQHTQNLIRSRYADTSWVVESL